MDFLNQDISLNPDPNRFMANANGEWIRNRKYRNPGWHFFKAVQSSGDYAEDVEILFKAEQFRDKKRYMKVFMPGFDGRTYTKVMAPKTFEAPEPYDTLPTPTLVVRQNGEAKTKPFVAIYEPFANSEKASSIVSVEKFEENGIFQGVKVTSKISNRILVQYLLIPFENGTLSLREHNIVFQGHFAMITFEENKLKDVYIGNGSNLKVGEYTLQSNSTSGDGYIDFGSKVPKLKGDFEIDKNKN